MLPPVPALEKLIGSLGIGNDTHVVQVPTGASSLDMGAATQIYRTFKVLGHDRVSILGGGWKTLSAKDSKTGKPANPIATGGVTPKPKVFKARLREDMLVFDALVKAETVGKATLADHRPSDFYLGIRKSTAATVAGTFSGAKNIE